MPRVIIDLPYVPESNQIAQILAQQVTNTLPGAEVQIGDTAPQQPDPASARGMSPQQPPTPPRPLTNQPTMARRQPQQAGGPIGRPTPV